MTPQERQLIDDLFDRLAKLENNPRDADAEDAIADGWDRAPNAAYALVQSVLVQEEALKRANDRIQQLEAQLGGDAAPPAPGGSFLDSARAAMGTQQGGGRGSVPSVHTSEPAPSKWNTGQAESRWNANAGQGDPQYPQGGGYPQGGYQQGGGYPGGGYPQQAGGGSFLGTAASAAAGVVGGALLMGGIRSLFGGGGGSAHASAFDPGLSGGGSSWAGSAGNSDLARDAGLGDIGHAGAGGSGEATGFFSGDDQGGGDYGGDNFADNDDFDADFGGDDIDT
jgi:hypothetical protein